MTNQEKKQFVVSIYDNKKHLVKVFTVGGKKQALIEAINICKKPIKDQVHLMGIADRIKGSPSVFDLWDCVELLQGIFEDWNVERPWLLYPKVREKAMTKINNELIEEIEDVKVYELEEAKKFIGSYNIAPKLLESLYYFDYDYMKNVVRGIHLKNLLKQKQKEQLETNESDQKDR